MIRTGAAAWAGRAVATPGTAAATARAGTSRAATSRAVRNLRDMSVASRRLVERGCHGGGRGREPAASGTPRPARAWRSREPAEAVLSRRLRVDGEQVRLEAGAVAVGRRAGVVLDQDVAAAAAPRVPGPREVP